MPERDLLLPALIPAPQFCEFKAGAAPLGALTAQRAATGLPGDAYLLNVAAAGATLQAGGERGEFLGRQTYQQIERQATGRQVPAFAIRDFPSLKIRGVHVDLKPPTAPRFEWFMQWIEQLARWKLNTIFIEYEDRFPFSPGLGIAHSAAWTREQIREAVARATQLNVTVVPLVQCLGHLEYVLVHEQYAALREAPEIYSQACPSNPATLELFKQMASEVLALHPNAPYFHIGADETSFLGHCKVCASRESIELYADYVADVCAWVASKGPRPVLWDDILRRRPEIVRRLPKSAVLMYWDYFSTGATLDHGKGAAATVDSKSTGIAPYAAYREAGFDVIMAPCFTGGALTPDVSGLPANCRFLAERAAVHGCLGVIATSWSCLFTPFSLSYHALAGAADAAWNPLPTREDLLTSRTPSIACDFDRRFCREFLGLPDDTLIHALRLLETKFMFRPEGGGYPCFISEPTFVDSSLLTTKVSAQEYAALCACLLRPDWPTRASTMSVKAAWLAKVEALKLHTGAAWFRAIVQEQLARAERGAALLELTLREANASDALQSEYVEGLRAGATAKLCALQSLHCQLQGQRAPQVTRGVRERLQSFYARSLRTEDATQLSDWVLSGIEEAP